MLLLLGWIKTKGGNRASPRNTDSKLEDIDKLMAYRKELMMARRNPSEFLKLVFRSKDDAWLDRCDSIIKRGPL